MSGALDGTRVLDLTRYIPGPFSTSLLAALGADIIKVEQPPIGDPTRLVPPARDGFSAAFAALNRGKRSIVVDLRQADGAEAVRRLADGSDVLVEGFRPGVLERLELGADALMERNPRLVFCSVTGFGDEGPLAQWAGHDINYAARAGLLAAFTGADGRPLVPATQLADLSGGLFATIAILAALQSRERTGRGQRASVSLLGAARSLLTMTTARFAAGGEWGGELAGRFPCYNVYRCRDGRYLSVGAIEPQFWETLCETLGTPELASRQWDPAHAAADVGRISDVLATRSRDEWVESLSSVDCCVEPVVTPDEELGGGPAREPWPVRMAGTPLAAPGAVPSAGEHSSDILEAAGYRSSEIDKLRESGVIA